MSDLPDKMYVRRLVPLSEEQKRSYTEMKRLALRLTMAARHDTRSDTDHASATDMLWSYTR